MVENLSAIAEELDVSMSQLAIAWCMKNPRVSTVITGATRIAQIKENLDAVKVKERLTDEVMGEINKVLGSK